jgi:hypothetical protein
LTVFLLNDGHRLAACHTRIGRSPVAVDPFRHQALVAEALVRNGAPFDPGEALGKGHLLRRRQLVERGDRFQPGLRIDPGAQIPPILLNLPRQQRLVAQRQ